MQSSPFSLSFLPLPPVERRRLEQAVSEVVAIYGEGLIHLEGVVDILGAESPQAVKATPEDGQTWIDAAAPPEPGRGFGLTIVARGDGTAPGIALELFLRLLRDRSDA